MSISVGRVGMVPIENIIVDADRAREILGDLDALETSMRESELITPLTMKDNHDGTFKLLAGERRFTVLKRNNIPEVPARIYDRDLTELEMKIIEKSENFFRKDFEYHELDKLTLEIHRMQQELHGVKGPGPASSGWGLADTGEMLGNTTKASISYAIKRAEIRESCPELFEKCKTASDADAVIKKMSTAVIKECIAKQVEEKSNSDVLLKQLANSYVVRNTFEGIKELPNNVFHLVEVDPPYAIDLHNSKKSEGESKYTLQDYNEIDIDDYINGDKEGKWLGIRTLLKECYRVMTDHSWLILWFAPEPWFEIMYQELKTAGFETTRLCPIWTKPTGQTKRPEMHLPNAYEMFFYAWKGRPAIAKNRPNNIYNYPPVPAQQKVHPTERPIELMKDIYETFAFPGSRVLIPFLGSGNGIISADQVGMSALGFDLGKSFKDSFLVKVYNMK